MGSGNDVRDWDEDSYRNAILHERDLNYRTVFRTAFSPDPNDPCAIVAASSDGSISAYSISDCISSSREPLLNCSSHQLSPYPISSAAPFCFLQEHEGPAYDVKFYGEGEDSILLSCGDDGRICGWRWKEIGDLSLINSKRENLKTVENLKPVVNFVNSQQKGPWNALSAIPENNAIDVNVQQGVVFSAAGDACAYSWDMETGQKKMVFRGHSDYLHSIVACKSAYQVVTGSEDGTARLWDCRTGKCTHVVHPANVCPSKESSWVSCIAIDSSESWLACGLGNNLSVWSLHSFQCIWNIDTDVQVQDTQFHDNQLLVVGSEPVMKRFNISGQILSRITCSPPSVFSICHHPSGITALGGYGGIVDLISEYGTHLCMFRCLGEGTDIYSSSKS